MGHGESLSQVQNEACRIDAMNTEKFSTVDRIYTKNMTCGKYEEISSAANVNAAAVVVPPKSTVCWRGRDKINKRKTEDEEEWRG